MNKICSLISTKCFLLKKEHKKQKNTTLKLTYGNSVCADCIKKNNEGETLTAYYLELVTLYNYNSNFLIRSLCGQEFVSYSLENFHIRTFELEFAFIVSI